VVFDAVAKSTFGACRRVLRPRGTYVTTLPSLGVFFGGAVLPAARLLGDGKRAKFLLVRPSGPDLELLGRFADAGQVRPFLTRTFPLDRAREAHEASEAGHTRGKIVLEVA
jgi:NADPH:quinone reductase-like Zn-dependent oxidoreductase